MKNLTLSLKKFSVKRSITLSLIVFSFVVPIIIFNSPNNFGSAHSALASPTEIFSLWNDTAPTLDGAIGFSAKDMSTEWSSAAVYYMYEDTSTPSSRLLLQNDNTNLYIGLDMTEYTIANPPAQWGFGIYLDIDHNGLLGNADRAVQFHHYTNGIEHVYYQQFSEATGYWKIIRTALPGVVLAPENIIADTAFGSSEFESTSHRQYEIRIPLNILQVSPGNITAIGIEAFDDYGDAAFESSITWPGLTSEPGRIWTDPTSWGDMYIGKDTSTSSYYAQYVIEENTNIRSDAIGMNNGTFMTTGDIDGNGDLELIVGSNMTDGTDINLLTIYDYIDSTLTPIWQSWESGHDTKMIKPMGLATHDFDEDGKDEIYICSDEDNRILRLFDWNASISDFDNSEYAYVHARDLRGYIAIGDVDNNAADGAEIAVGDKEGALGGNMIIVGYTIGTDTFAVEKSFTPGITLGSATRRIHAIDIADMDEDGDNELLYACQYSIDDSLSYTALKIEYSGFLGNYFDNPEDDLPATSASATADQFTHSILVADVDNDGNNEIVLVGKNYLKIFGPNTFSGANAPIELIINSTSLPNMGGGVAFGDIDLDGAGELIIGASNGTLYFLNITDSGSDNLSYTIEWQSDIGDSPGKQEAMVVYDLDNDSENELFVGDNYGQIMSIGKGQAPTVSITSPSFGQTKKDVAVEFTWEAIDDYSMHHFDVYVNSTFVARTGGAQTGIILELAQGENYIFVNGFDITGLNDSAYTEVNVNLNSPEVTIINPEDDFPTNENFINLELSVDDINDDFNHYDFYINELYVDSTVQDFITLSLPIANGYFNITVVAIDDDDNEGRDTVFIIHDTIDPNIVITSPFDGAAVKNSEITVQWTANDFLSGIDYYQIWLDGNFVTNVFSANSYLVPLGIDDEYAITVFAFDKAGNSKDDTNIITKDTVNPTVDITSHVDGYITPLTSINLVWDSEDNYGREIHHTEVTVNDNPRYSGGLEEATINLENNKINEVLVTTYDLAGNIGQDAINVIVDNSNPFIEILAPVSNYNTSMDSVTVYWNSSDTGSGISHYVILVDSTPYTTIYDPFVTSHTIDLPTDKSYTIVVRAFDYSGHQFADVIIVTKNSSMEEIAITNPSPTYCYITTTTVTMNWLVANIVNVTMFEIYINGQLNFTINDNTTRSYLIDFGAIPIDQYPTYNITIVAYTTTPLEMYTDMIWLTIDQSAPYLSITNPINNSDVSDNLIYLQWDSHDDGSGLERYTIKVDGIVVSSGVGEINSQYLLLNDSFGAVIITIEVWDIATNTAQSMLSLNVYLTLPVATINLQNPFYTNTNELDFDLSITNAQTGVSSIFVYTKETDAGITPPDLRDVFDYTSDIQYSPFSLPITINLPVTDGEYLLTVSIIDSFGHEELIECVFYIDHETPGITLTTINGRQLLSNGGSEQSEIEIARTATSFTVSAYVSDDLGLHTVQVRINGTSKDGTYFDETYFMSPNNVSTSTAGNYSTTINLADIPLGEYTIEITVTDLAGNSIKYSYAIELKKESGLPPFLQGNNLIYLSVGIAVFLIFIVLMSVVVRKRVANLGWKNEIITAAYILNGLPCVYMMNKPEKVSSDLLFGGAMAGIRGVLEEITGEKSKLKIQSVDVGEKKVLICPGNFGDSVLMLNKLKPIHRDKILAFTLAFEKDYNHLLTQEDLLITTDTFRGANILVQVHFGLADNMDLVDDCELDDLVLNPTEEHQAAEPTYQIETQERPATQYLEDPPETQTYAMEPATEEAVVEEPQIQEVTAIEPLVSKLSSEKQKLFVELITATQNGVSAILERDYEQTRQANAAMLEILESFLTDESIPAQLNVVLQSIFLISQQLVTAIDNGEKGNEQAFAKAAEQASQIWLKDISEKW